VELSKTLTRVRALIAKAESLENIGDSHSMNEALALREKANGMMDQYGLEEWELLKEAPTGFKPTRIKVDIGEAGNPFLGETSALVNTVSRFCKCSSVWMKGSGYKGVREEYCYVYGYESDLRYFELLFTTIYLHMAETIFPKPDPNLSLGENAYELHNAGLNWFDIAQAYGWAECPSFPGEPKLMYFNKSTGERESWGKSIGRIKSAYTAEIKARGEAPLRIPPSGSETFRRNAVQGYLHRIAQRLAMITDKRGTGMELVLADKSQNIAAMIQDDFDNVTMQQSKRVTFNAAAYRRGVNHANTASLNPEATSAPRGELS
jgi:Protein of unknown function (DUF2786)